MKAMRRFAPIAAGVSLAVGGGLVQAADSITVVSWGGAYTKSQVEAYHKPLSLIHISEPTRPY